MSSKQIIAIFGFLKLTIHLLFNNNYGLHRDEYLYFAEGQHLGWGYMEGPPMIGLLAFIANIFGSSAFALRLLPALAGVASIVIIGAMVRELGGKRWAVVIACLAFLISPNYLRSNMMFQPVSFNQLCWLMTLSVVILIIKREEERLWYLLGIIIGIGLMTKYSIIFLLLPLLTFSLLFASTRKWYGTKYPYIGIGIALVLVLPNIWWQFTHNFPVLTHMRALASSQLVNVSPFSFIRDQFLNHLANSFVWVAGLVLILFDKEMSKYRLVGLTYFGLILLLLVLSGKSYYSMGIYSTLFVFGGIAIEKYIKSPIKKSIFVGFLMITLIPFIPYALPVLSIDKLTDYCRFMDEKIGLDAPIIWENGRKYPIPQDYADMRGWEDMVQRVARVYHSLPDDEKASCSIWGGSYGHAGAINFFRDKYNLPEAYSLNASFMIWCPMQNDFKVQIDVDDSINTSTDHFEEVILIDSSEVRLARDPGYITLRRYPKVNVPEVWEKSIREAKAVYNFE